LIAVVQFEMGFTDRSSGAEWPPKQASCHYHLEPDKDRAFRIKKIQYWTETFPDTFASLFQTWAASREKVLVDLAKGYLSAKP
jgi:hypothetical protein